MSKRLRNFYITSNGKLIRKENTIYFSKKEKETPLPLHKIYSIYILGQVTISSQVINILAKEKKLLHFFDYYGNYNGTFYPREKLNSGNVVINQSNYYLISKKRLELAKLFIKGGSLNMMKVLEYYKIKNKIPKFLDKLKYSKTVNSARGVEGIIRQEYYSKFDTILPNDFSFVSRMMHPPENKVNAMISFGNALLYSTILNETYNTQINPTISYLHELSDSRFSLTYDISEIFKPIIVDRLIFYLIKRKMMKKEYYKEINGGIYLNTKGKKCFYPRI